MERGPPPTCHLLYIHVTFADYVFVVAVVILFLLLSFLEVTFPGCDPHQSWASSIKTISFVEVVVDDKDITERHYVAARTASFTASLHNMLSLMT